MQLETSTGVKLAVGRIARKRIDDYIASNPPPKPPQLTVTVFGDATETVDNLDDPSYRAALVGFNLRMANEEFAMIAQALTLIHPERWQEDPRVEELTALGIAVSSITDYLRYVALAEQRDLARVVEEVLYQSTVTQRGVDEAERAFSITYHGLPLSNYPNPAGDTRISSLYQARLAATSLGYVWEQFCALTGQEQSAAVAQYQCGAKLRYLAEREQEQKSRAITNRRKR